jgi:hypothetical protein
MYAYISCIHTYIQATRTGTRTGTEETEETEEEEERNRNRGNRGNRGRRTEEPRNRNEREREAEMDMRALIHGHADFVLRFFQRAVAMELSAPAAQQNAALSPIGISIVLAMAASGAKGPTLHQILSTLNLPSSDALRDFASQARSALLATAARSGGPLLEFVNSAWVQKTLTPLNLRFTQDLHKNYGVKVQPADFLNQVCAFSVCIVSASVCLPLSFGSSLSRHLSGDFPSVQLLFWIPKMGLPPF